FFIGVGFIHASPFFLPLCPGIEKPVRPTGIAHLHALCEAIVIGRSYAGGGFARAKMETTLRVVSREWRLIRLGFDRQEDRVTIPRLMGIAETSDDIEVLGRHPEHVGIENMLIYSGEPSQIDEGVVTRTKRRHWLAEGGVESGSREARP